MQLRRNVVAWAIVGLAGWAGAQQRSPLERGWELAVETVAGERPTEGWRKVKVPGTFEDVLGEKFDGVAWYRIALASSGEAEAVRVLFHGAATHARVFADGVEVGAHLGAWTPWSVDVTRALADGSALLEVRVDEKVGHNTQGFLPVIQPHFGGLWRSVELCADFGPVIEREQVFVFGDAAGEHPRVRFEVPVLAASLAEPLRLKVTLLEDAKELATREIGTVTGHEGRWNFVGELEVPDDVRRWDPERPELYTVAFELLSGERKLGQLPKRVGFRDLRTDGTRITLNGRPLQLRGMLHWGYSPPHFAPPEDRAYWRTQLESIKSLGCNLLKACLWVPPECVYELCDEIGLIVWQEYPTWHPTLTGEHLAELRREYDEFHRYDRSHVSVALRSLTCETGHSAELSVIQALYDRCKQLAPQALVVDDSAWIEWHRVHDFYDDHPYGNNSWWPGKLAQMREHIAARKPKPLVLGECIAADTWMDLARWDKLHGDEPLWWQPWGLAPQLAFEERLERLFGAETRASLRPISLEFALRNRKYQIERLRVSAPDAGYTLSVVRDFTKARMGFFDDFDELKWTPEQWSWHRDTLIALEPGVRRDSRALGSGPQSLGLRVAHSGLGRLAGTLVVRVPELGVEQESAVLAESGEVSSRLGLSLDLPPVERPTPLEVSAELRGAHPASNTWKLWRLPKAPTVAADAVRVVEKLDAATLEFVKQGGRALLVAGDRTGSLRTDSIWFLKGAPFAPPHALNDKLPQDFLIELSSFDLENGTVLHGDAWLDHVDPLLGFWDTHDIAHVNPWLFAFTTRYGKGRLGATVLERSTPAGQYVFSCLLEHLANGPDPRASVPPELAARLERALSAAPLDLVQWQIAFDPTDRGVADGWFDGGEHAGAQWAPIEAGKHWENAGFEHRDGVAWYRTSFELPTHWKDDSLTLVCEGVDDSYRVYLDGRELARHGNPETNETVWLVRTTTDLTGRARAGERHSLVLRVVDHVGSGGVYKPVYITTGPADATGDLVH